MDKFARLVVGLGLSADQVLHEVGYLPTAPELPEPKSYLRRRFQLTPQATEQALAFLAFLKQQSRKTTKTSSRRTK